MRRAPALLAVGLLLAVAKSAVGEPMRPLPGTVPRALRHLVASEPAPADLPLENVTIVLGLRDRTGLDAVIAAQQDRHSARYGRWLDLDEIADRFGPSRSEYERVRAWFVGQGFRVVRDSASRVAIVVAGTAGQAGTALAAPIWLYRGRDRMYHGPRVDPSVPESIGELLTRVHTRVSADAEAAFYPWLIEGFRSVREHEPDELERWRLGLSAAT